MKQSRLNYTDKHKGQTMPKKKKNPPLKKPKKKYLGDVPNMAKKKSKRKTA